MPRLGWASEEGTLIEWLKKDGDPVRTGDVVCVIESDKAQVEVESFDAGVLRIPPASPAPGAKVPVGTLLGYVLAPGEALPAAAPRARPAPLRADAADGAPPVEAGRPPSRRPRPGAPRGGPPRARGRAASPRSSAWTGRRSGEAAARGASWSATSGPRAPTGRAPCAGSSASG